MVVPISENSAGYWRIKYDAAADDDLDRIDLFFQVPGMLDRQPPRRGASRGFHRTQQGI